ncbi:MAG: hypothetical protein ACRD29_22875 [Acidimicrobiales bacterium]
MAAPEYVPVKPMDDVRAYESPPRRPDPWLAERPGDLGDGQPTGRHLGWQGPDQGYALLLANRFRDKLHLEGGDHLEDVVEGAIGVALKRASLFGRAPVIHDLTVAFTVWGFLDPHPPADLVALRRRAFDEVSIPLHYVAARKLVDAVSPDVLSQPHTRVAEAYKDDWRQLIDISALA